MNKFFNWQKVILFSGLLISFSSTLLLGFGESRFIGFKFKYKTKLIIMVLIVIGFLVVALGPLIFAWMNS